MSDQSAIRLLQAAIETVREECTGSEYKDLLAACNTADSACEKASGEPDDNKQDVKEENTRARQPLKKAAEKARGSFAQMRDEQKQDNFPK